MKNQEIAKIFQSLANFLESEGVAFKPYAYQRAAIGLGTMEKDVEEIYKKGKLHPLDLKKAVSFYLNEMIKPVREYFEKNRKAKVLYEEVKKYSVTR